MTIGNVTIVTSLINQSVSKQLNRKSIYNKKNNFTVSWKALKRMFCFVFLVGVVILNQAILYFSCFIISLGIKS